MSESIYNSAIDSIIYAEPFRSMSELERVQLIGAILDQMNLPESIQETVKAIASDYQP